jgi:hypothetical protein
VQPLEIPRAILFTPGRSSDTVEAPQGDILVLSEASEHRADTAAAYFNPDSHVRALFAGGFPGMAQGWPKADYPPDGQSEARLMAERFQQNEQFLASIGKLGLPPDLMSVQGDSNNSIGDVAQSMAQGYLDIDAFHSEGGIDEITLVTGALHGQRFRQILSKGLGIDRKQIKRVAMRDIYGAPPSRHLPEGQSAAKAVAIEMAAITINHLVMRDVEPGNVESLLEAEERFAAYAQKLTH